MSPCSSGLGLLKYPIEFNGCDALAQHAMRDKNGEAQIARGLNCQRGNLLSVVSPYLPRGSLWVCR
jgi:hypothetical protein